VLTTAEVQNLLCLKTTVRNNPNSTLRIHFLHNLFDSTQSTAKFPQASTPVNMEQQLLHNKQHINTADFSTHHHTKFIMSADHTSARQHDHISMSTDHT
jgi:hypothetical protein